MTGSRFSGEKTVFVHADTVDETNAPTQQLAFAHMERLGYDVEVVTGTTGLDGIALIDNNPAPDGAEGARWTHIIFDQPQNRDTRTDYRIEGWHDPRLQGLLGRCARNYDTFTGQ